MNLPDDIVVPVNQHPPGDLRHWVRLPVVTPPLSQSGMKTLGTCPMKFAFAERFRLSKRGYKSALSIGHMFHHGAAALWQGHTLHTAIRGMNEYVADQRAAIADWAEEAANVERAAEILKKMDQDLEVAIAMVSMFFQRAHELFGTVKPIIVEEEISIEVPGVDVPVRGRLDVLLDTVVGGRRVSLVTDYKATDSPARYAKTAAFSSQLMLYMMLAKVWREATPERRAEIPEIGGGVYCLIMKPSCRRKRDQTLESYVHEVVDWYAAKAGEHDGTEWDWTKNASKFAEDPPVRHVVVTGPVFQPDLFYRELKWYNKSATDDPTFLNFPKRGEYNNSCVDTYGSECEFLHLCGLHPSNWEAEIAKHYTIRELQVDPAGISKLQYLANY